MAVKAIGRRLRLLEEQIKPRVNERGQTFAEVVRQRRQQRLDAAGLQFEVDRADFRRPFIVCRNHPDGSSTATRLRASVEHRKLDAREPCSTAGAEAPILDFDSAA